MMVLGLDPGPSVNGWAVIDFTIRSAPLWFAHGTTSDVMALCEELLSNDALFDDSTVERCHRIQLVAVEQARALHNPMANIQAMATAWAGGEAAGIFRRAGFQVVPWGVNQWRQAFVGHSQRGDNIDHKVEEQLRRLVRGMPARTNVHSRDAAGVACVAARDWRPRVQATHTGLPHPQGAQRV